MSSNKFGDTVITEAFVLPSKVIHLVIRKPPKFRFKPGDYVFINIPIIAKYEWHPFSISSAPENCDYLWLHVKACGNWTNKLYSYSLSSKFDLSTSFASQSSNLRATMRSRMSKSLNDSNAFPLFMKQRSEFNNCTKGESKEDEANAKNGGLAKKVVSFVPVSVQDQQTVPSQATSIPIKSILSTNTAMVSVKEIEAEKENVQLAYKSKNLNDNVSQLKVNKTLFRSMSFNGNETINAIANNQQPFESTPKHYKNDETNEEEETTNHDKPKFHLNEDESNANNEIKYNKVANLKQKAKVCETRRRSRSFCDNMEAKTRAGGVSFKAIENSASANNNEDEAEKRLNRMKKFKSLDASDSKLDLDKLKQFLSKTKSISTSANNNNTNNANETRLG